MDHHGVTGVDIIILEVVIIHLKISGQGCFEHVVVDIEKKR